MKVALIVPGGVARSGESRVIPALLWMIERLAAAAEVHVFALHQEPQPGTWPLLDARVHNAGRRPVLARTLAALLAEHRRGRFDVVHAYWASGAGVAAAVFRALTRTPTAVTLPGGDLCALPEIGYGARLTRAGRLRVRLALAAADRVLVPSRAMQAEAAALGVRAQVVRFGVALDRWPPAAPRRRSPGSPVRLAQVADLNAVKDLDTLLDALARLDRRGVDFRLDQLGLDTLDGAIQRRAAALGLSGRVAFHGHCPREDVRRLVERADLMLVSARHEGVPIAALEAAVAGVPTVGTEVGQIADWAPRAAVAVPVGDAEALAEAIAELAGDEDRRLALAHAARADAIRHDADAFVRGLLALYRDLAARRPVARKPRVNAMPG